MDVMAIFVVLIVVGGGLLIGMRSENRKRQRLNAKRAAEQAAERIFEDAKQAYEDSLAKTAWRN